VPCGHARYAPDSSKKGKAIDYSLVGPGSHPDPAAAKVRASDGPQVVEERCGKWKEPESCVLN
jgi:hypothetical protein